MTNNDPPLRILLVEDEPINQKVVQLMLDNLGCQYDSACTGNEALTRATQFDYDLILMDIQLPDLNGIEVTKQLRSKGVTSPIVATTAYSFEDELDTFIASGMNDVLLKPFRQEQILTLIKKWTRHYKELA